MLRAAIVEHDKDKRELIENVVKLSNFDIQTVGFSNEYDFKDNIDETCSSIDILLTNTTLREEGDGVALAGYVRERSQTVMICFVTDSDDYYRDAFSVFATGYLKFPINPSELINAINFHFKKTVRERRASWMIKEAAGLYRRIYCRNILYIESDNREIILHLEDGSQIHSYNKLDKAEEALPKKQFLRCHQSYIVNMFFVDKMERSAFYLADDTIPISRKYQSISKTAYQEYETNKK